MKMRPAISPCWEDAGIPYQLLESSRLAEVEPALAEVAHKLTGGLQLPNDETGDCQLFTQNLAPDGGAGGGLICV